MAWINCYQWNWKCLCQPQLLVTWHIIIMWSLAQMKKINDHRNYFSISLHESYDLNLDLTWISSQTHYHRPRGCILIPVATDDAWIKKWVCGNGGNSARFKIRSSFLVEVTLANKGMKVQVLHWAHLFLTSIFFRWPLPLFPKHLL